MNRPTAVAGTWYPGTPAALTREVDTYLDAAPAAVEGDLRAIIVPHAGIIFSGPVGAYAYNAAAGRNFEVAYWWGRPTSSRSTAWRCGPMAPSRLRSARRESMRPARAAISASPVVQPRPDAHRREHSLEMQLPFLKRVLPDVPIVPLLIGFQRRDTIEAVAQAIATAFAGRRALLVASTDLSHYLDANTATQLDARVQQCVNAFDADALLELFEQYPEHQRGQYVACGGGAAIAVMKAAKALGATSGRVLKYGHSGEVSGDYDGVVGYMAAAMGTFANAH
jgi:AmmeMemoRadiSam system protein B